MDKIIEKIQVNIPFKMLYDSYLDLFISKKLNPEIGLSFEALDIYSFSTFNKIADQLHRHGLKITLHGPFMDLSPGSPDPSVRELARRRFEQMLKLVPVFKPKTVVCHTGFDWKRYWTMKDEWVENSLEFWSWLGACIRDEGSALMLENVYEHYPEDILVLLENLENQNVGFCFDAGHQNAFSRSSLSEWVEKLKPFIRQFHLHDNCGKWDDHLGMGKGDIDFPKLFSMVNLQLDDKMIITLEPHREEDFETSLLYLKKLWNL